MTSGGGFRALIQSGGGKALYAGVFGNLAGVAPASAIFMAVYEPVKVRWNIRRGGHVAKQAPPKLLGVLPAINVSVTFLHVN